MDEIRYLHREEFGQEPEVVATAPGTVNLIGEHTGHNDGLVIEAAINRQLSVAVSKRPDNSLRFFAADLLERKRTTIPNLKFRREDRWANYPKGVLYELMQLGYNFSGFDLTISSTIPSGIGLGASAALGVASAIALSELFGADLSEFQVVQSAAMAELSFLNVKTSLTDHLVSTVARERNAVYVDLRDLSYEYVPVEHTDIAVFITISNVPHVSPEKELASRSRKCNECIAQLRDQKSRSSLRDVDSSEIRDTLDGLPEDVRRICSHVAEENKRVIEAQRLLSNRKYEQFGKLMTRSHESLRDNYEVSCPEVDWLVKRATETSGIYGSRMAGPGFGGCTVSIAREDAVPQYLENIEEYERIFGFKPEVMTLAPASGAMKMPSLANR